ncbi:hypothetical protein [Mumia zhuanghuii]|uniref:Uncharacterized protein n=1 Tax=Mumia zhuanghuii TaxID=2585211 RepID=A0A5C4MF07_9ACTN|nr:hypothetical protein [Mumia zhuanghuii]TNC31318.1 hypothetical protein FHE65_32125 [Mumia zhuanghuii]
MDEELLGCLVELQAIVVLHDLEQALDRQLRVVCQQQQDVLELERRRMTLVHDDEVRPFQHRAPRGLQQNWRLLELGHMLQLHAA